MINLYNLYQFIIDFFHLLNNISNYSKLDRIQFFYIKQPAFIKS